MARRFVIRSCDDDYEADDSLYFETGSAYEMSGPAERRKLISVSDAAWDVINSRRVAASRPIGFHRPKT